MGNRSGTSELTAQAGTKQAQSTASAKKAAAVPVSLAPSGGNVWLREATALFGKDLRAELRTKVALSSVGLFTLAALMLIALATNTLKDTMLDEVRPAWSYESRFGMLWVLLCFAAFAGLSHSFVHEEETGTTTALRLSMSPEGVYAGKFAFNLALVLVIAAGATPLYMLATDLVIGQPVVFFLTMLAGSVGLAASATFMAALAAKSQGTGALYGALGLPLLLVFLVLLLGAARTVYLVNPPLAQVVKNVGGIVSFDVFLITLSALTFRYVWED